MALRDCGRFVAWLASAALQVDGVLGRYKTNATQGFAMDMNVSPALLVDRVLQSRQGQTAQEAQMLVMKKAMDMQESASAALLNAVAGDLKPTSLRCSARPASMLAACCGNHSTRASARRVMISVSSLLVVRDHGVAGFPGWWRGGWRGSCRARSRWPASSALPARSARPCGPRTRGTAAVAVPAAWRAGVLSMVDEFFVGFVHAVRRPRRAARTRPGWHWRGR